MNWKIALFLFFSSTTTIYGQGETNVWYFGRRVGIDFNVNPPRLLYDGQTESTESTGAISDSLGNLLFYSDGIYVWDKNHEKLALPEKLMGGLSSTQSALFIPRPGNLDNYYVFTADTGPYGHPNTRGIYYTILNTCILSGQELNFTFPEVNVSLLSPNSEKLAAVYHSNGTDVWIVSQEWNTNKYYTWLISENGISDPVISEIGYTPIDDSWNSIGQIKFSPDGTMLASATYSDGVIQLFDFNNNK